MKFIKINHKYGITYVNGYRIQSIKYPHKSTWKCEEWLIPIEVDSETLGLYYESEEEALAEYTKIITTLEKHNEIYNT
jgi:hypothetical protein